MRDRFRISLARVVSELRLFVVAGGHLDLTQVMVGTSEVNRPGLPLTGYMTHFATERLQVAGWTEMAYLNELPPDVRAERLEAFFCLSFPALIVTRGMYVTADIVDAANRHGVAVLATDRLTSETIGLLNRFLVQELAPRTEILGSFVDVYGEGVLIMGHLGMARAETALELVRRGHRLIGAQSVEVRRISDVELEGIAPANDRHMLDLAGVGKIDVAQLYGVAAVKSEARVSFEVLLEQRVPGKEYERLGMDEVHTSELGVALPVLTIPVQPGRNLAVTIEVAAINHRQRVFGYNAAADLEARMLGRVDITGI